LHEELYHAEEKLDKTTHSKILLAVHRYRESVPLTAILQQLACACDAYSEAEIKKILKQIIPELGDL
jgi:FlaA1/EpsC-like NDP-sugar epimerase